MKHSKRNGHSEMARKICCALVLGLALSQGFCAEKTSRPNIMLIMSDDHSWYDAGCYGNTDVKTPNLDKLAAEGARFTQCFTCTSVCAPTRYQIQSGRYPNEAKLYGNYDEVVSKMKFETLASVLKKAGYRTLLAGKRHLLPESNYPYEFLTGENGRDEVSVAAFEKFISEPQDKPFLFVLTFHDPHSGWPIGLYDPNIKQRESGFDASLYDPSMLKIPPSMADTPVTRRNLAAYYQKVSRLDRNLGKALAALDASPAKNNTLVLWTSEQGMQTPRSKWTCYDLGLRTAMLARWPGVIKPGSERRAMVQYVDVLPTLNELAGGAPVAGVNGKSFLPVLLGKEDKFRDVVYGATFGFYSARGLRYKYIWNSKNGQAFKHMFMSDLKNESTELYRDLLAEEEKGNAMAKNILGWLRQPPHEEVYDTEADPFELQNLAGKPEVADVQKRLRESLRAWLTEQKDQALPILNNEFPFTKNVLEPLEETK